MYVSNRVKWPYSFMLAGNSKDNVTFYQVCPVHWMVGFSQTMTDEPNLNLRNKILDYVIYLMMLRISRGSQSHGLYKNDSMCLL